MSQKLISKQEQQRSRVYNFYIDNKDKGKQFTVDHFLAEKIPRATIYSIIQRAENEFGHNRRIGSGRRAIKIPQNKVNQLKTMINNKDNVSYRKAARKFNVTPSYVHKIIKSKSNIKKRTKIKIPERNEQQKIEAKTKCGRLLRKFPEHEWIIDDESYFTLSHSTINGNNIFYTDDIDSCPSSVKYYTKSKFGEKILIWAAFSSKGMSNIYIVPNGLAVNKELYLNECIIKRLIPFIKQHHQNNNFVFWPDKASSHYAKIVQAYLSSQNIKFVAYEDNPSSLPEARPIEDFWSILKGIVYKDGWEAENIEQLRNRIRYCLQKIDTNLVQALAEGIPKRLDLIRRKGVVETR